MNNLFSILNVKIKKNIDFISLLIFLLSYLLIYFGDFIYSNLLLADDYLWQTNLKLRDYSIYNFLNIKQFSPRPLSGIVYYFMMNYFKNSSEILHTINLSFYFISIFVFLLLLKKYLHLKVEHMAVLLIIVILFPFSASTLFCPIMINSNLAILFYFLSVLILFSKLRLSLLISSLFYILSVLSYEVCAPFVLINLLIIVKQNNYEILNKNFIKKITLFIIPLLVYIFYRFFIEKIIFTNYFVRAVIPTSFFQKLTGVTLSLIKLLFVDYFIFLKKSILGLSYYNLTDFITLIFGIIAVFLSIKIYLKNPINNKPSLKISFFLLALTFIIFFLLKINYHLTIMKTELWVFIDLLFLYYFLMFYMVLKNTPNSF